MGPERALVQHLLQHLLPLASLAHTKLQHRRLHHCLLALPCGVVVPWDHIQWLDRDSPAASWALHVALKGAILNILACCLIIAVASCMLGSYCLYERSEQNIALLQ